MVPRFTGFIIDEITPQKNSEYYTLTLREVETRRIYYKDVVFNEETRAPREDFFGHLFAIGEGMARSTTLETRTAIREGRVIPGMTVEEVGLAVGEPTSKVTTSDGIVEWMYPRTNSVLVVQFDEDGIVTKAGARATGTSSAGARRAASQSAGSRRLTGNGTPLQ